MPPVINPLLCDGCTRCVRACPGDILYFDNKRKIAVVKYPDECWHCDVCNVECTEHLKGKSAITFALPPEWLK